MSKTIKVNDAAAPGIRICLIEKFKLPEVVRLKLYAVTCRDCGSEFEIDGSDLHRDHGVDGRGSFAGWTVGNGWGKARTCPCGGSLKVNGYKSRKLDPTRTVYLVRRHGENDWVMWDSPPTSEYLDVTTEKGVKNLALED